MNANTELDETTESDMDETIYNFDLDFSGFFSLKEDEKRKKRISKIMEGMKK